MRDSTRNTLICGLIGGMSTWAGLVTSASADAFAVNGTLHICDTGAVTSGIAACSASVGDNASASSQATATYGMVSAFVSGGAVGQGNGSYAVATSSFTDTLTIFGGSGTGVLSIVESILNFGTGSLESGDLGLNGKKLTVTQTFTYGTPFTLTLSALASASFFGSDCDGGTLLVQKSIESLKVSGERVTYTDGSGHAYNTAGTAVLTAAPEPGAWVLALIGLGLVALAKGRLSRPKAATAHDNRQ